MKFLSVLISLQVAAVAVLLSSSPAQCGVIPQWPGHYAEAIKGYLVNLVKDRIIDRSKMMSSFQDTMVTINNRYDTEKQSLGTTATDVEQQALYYKIVVDELRNLRARIDKDSNNKDVDDGEGLEDLKSITISPSKEEVVDTAHDDVEEKDLLNQLDELEAMNESEMGWSMDAEQRRILGERTKRVLTDLLQNELRQLAMALITSYMSGSPIAPIAAALVGSIRFKMVEYFMNIVMDSVSSLMGRRPNVQPFPDQAEVTPAMA